MPAFGPYVVEGELGHGAAGVVFRARDPDDATGAAVAVKVLLRRAGQEARAARRMEREMRVLERLRHPAIVAVRATGEARGALWIAMDLVEGRSLQERLDREGPLPTREAASLLLELARAVAHAHAEGVLHRDLEPANVLLDRAGRPLLADFGLAKDLTGTLHGQSLSTSGQFLGTPGYWPPEQARGEHGQIGPASDVYGLGALLYAMLTGEPPSGRSDTLIEAMAAVEREPPPPSQLRPDVPAALDAICARCLRRSPADRYDSAADVADAVQGWLVVRRARGRARRRVPALAALAALLLVVAVGSALALWPGAGAIAPATEPVAAADVTSAAQAPSAMSHATEELARLMAAGDSRAVLAFLDALPPELQGHEQMTLSRALTCLELGLIGVTGGSPADGEAHLERAVALTRDAADPDLQLVSARALSALGRHDAAIAAFAPLLAAPGDLGAPLFYGALVAGERAFPEASRSFFGGPVRGDAETLGASRHLNSVVGVQGGVLPRDRARAHVALARALHAARIMVEPDALDSAIEAAPDDPDARLARAERGLARRDLASAEGDLRVVRAQERALTPAALARLTLLSHLLQLEQLLARGETGQAASLASSALRELVATDAWTAAAGTHLRARRHQALGLPPPGQDRPLTPEELDRLHGLARLLQAPNRLEQLDDVVEALPPRAHEQAQVVTLRASMHLERASELAQAGEANDARVQHERALALLTPPREQLAHVVRAEVLSALGRWSEAVNDYAEALRQLPGSAASVRANALVAARGAFPTDLWASFLVPGPRPGARPEATAFLRGLLLPDEPPSAERLTVLVSLARACHAQGDAVGAADMLRAAGEEDPADKTLLFARAEWHTAAGRFAEAEADLRALGDPPNPNKTALTSVLAAEKALAAGDAGGLLLIEATVRSISPRDDPWLQDVATHLRARARQAAGGGGD